MARHEEDRDDLFTELKHWSPRWELCIPHEAEPVLVARRGDGRLAIYFGQDPCFHFNSDGQLLRAFVAGVLYRTQGDHLAQLQRHRSDAETQLCRTDLTDLDLLTFRTQVTERIQRFADSLSSSTDPAALILRTSEPEVPALKATELLIRQKILPIELAPAYPTRRR